MKYIKLNQNIEIPALGLGTYRLTEPAEVRRAVLAALEVGYRHFDTADIYGNHRQLARVFKESGIDRGELFITSKIWNSDHGYNNTFRVYDRLLNELETDYLDLFLIHWPGFTYSYLDTWQAMIELYKNGRVRSIGVSNFLISHLEKLLEETGFAPAVNQIELHPYLVDWELVNYCREHNIAIEAWAPILKGQMAGDPVLIEIGKKYGKTPVQVALRWHIQNGFIAIPKSANPQRIRENFDIWDFELSDDDMQKINALNRGYRRGPDPRTFF